MNSEAAQERIISLSNDIHNYNHLYYVENKSVISDYEFDLLLKELQDLEKSFPEFQQVNSPTQRVGGDISKKFNTVAHQYPMLSLGNTYAEDEIVEWSGYPKIASIPLLPSVDAGIVAKEANRIQANLIKFI